MKLQKITHSLAFTMALLAGAPAMAASTWTWTGVDDNTIPLPSAGQCDIPATLPTTSTVTCNSNPGGKSVSLTAYATGYNTNSPYNSTTFDTAALGWYSGGGFGVRNLFGAGTDESTAEPQHGLDNNKGTELIALNFGSAVALNEVKIGYAFNDSDLSVLRYTGSALTLDAAIKNKTTLGLIGNGWELVATIPNASTVTAATFNTGANAVSSSWWLISAYDSGYGTTLSGDTYTVGTSSSAGYGSDSTTKYDYTKVLAFAANAPVLPPAAVPEPSSMLLVALGMLGMAGLRRRQRV